MPSFGLKDALEFLYPQEGGESSDAYDRGGQTYRGISIVHHPDWAGWYHIRGGDYTAADALVDKFYEENYWKPAHCWELPPPIALVVFDGAVHSGVGRSVGWLQKAVDAFVDGDCGPRTRAAVKRDCEREGAEAVALETLSYRMVFMVRGFRRGSFSPGQPLRYLGGYFKRMVELAYEVGDFDNEVET